MRCYLCLLVYCFFSCRRSHTRCIFFFFQAEDGIRLLTVTGVQTCALPICSLPSSHPVRQPGRVRTAPGHCTGWERVPDSPEVEGQEGQDTSALSRHRRSQTLRAG